MARHKGNNGVVKSGGTALGDVVDWDVETTAAEVDLSGLNDAWDQGEAGSKSWGGNVTLHFNTADATQEAMVAGSAISLSLYTAGDASGKQYFSGTAYVTTVSIGSVSRNTGVAKKVAFKGTGSLDSATVV